jgi:hypothetical protein
MPTPFVTRRRIRSRWALGISSRSGAGVPGGECTTELPLATVYNLCIGAKDEWVLVPGPDLLELYRVRGSGLCWVLCWVVDPQPIPSTAGVDGSAGVPLPALTPRRIHSRQASGQSENLLRLLDFLLESVGAGPWPRPPRAPQGLAGADPPGVLGGIVGFSADLSTAVVDGSGGMPTPPATPRRIRSRQEALELEQVGRLRDP